MARTFTFGELIDRFRKIGEYEDLDGDYSSDAPSAPSSGTILTYMDVAHRRAWEHWSESDEGWNVVRVTASLSSSQSIYPLPDDFHRLRGLELSVGNGGWFPLDRANSLDDSIAGGSPGSYPVAYRLFSDSYELLPAPGTGASVRISYTPVAARISSSLQTCPGSDGFDEVVVYRSLVMSRQREEKDTSEFRASAVEIEQLFANQAKHRDRGAPRRMRPRGGLGRIRRRGWNA